MSRDDIQAIIGFIKEIHSKVTGLVDAGKSEDEVRQAFGIQEPPKKEGLWMWPPLAMKVYLELAKRSRLNEMRTIKD